MATFSGYDYTSRLAFDAEWLAPGGYIFKFYLNYYPFDNSVELWEKTKNKLYLRRTICDNISFKDMFTGNTVRIYGRQVSRLDCPAAHWC